MYKRLFQAVIIITAFLIVSGQLVLAQSVRGLEKLSQNYIETGNDIRCYQIIYDPTNEKDYLVYTELLREKIKAELKKRYSRYSGEGDVCLLFILNSNGSLYAFDLTQDSTENKRLRDIALRGLKGATPFPSFPEALTYDRMAFHIIISFRKHE
jgi:hypothetical protein